MLLISIETKMLQIQIFQHSLNSLDVIWRAEPLPSPAFKVASTPKLMLESVHKHFILTWQHFLFHGCKATGKHLRFIGTVELTSLWRLCQQRIHDFNDLVTFSKNLHSHLAQTLIRQRAVWLWTKHKAIRNIFETDLIHLCLKYRAGRNGVAR